MKLGYGKGSKTGNDLDKTRELNKNNSKFKRNIIALNKKVIQEKYGDKGDDNDKPEDSGNQFGWKQSYKKSKKN